MKMFKVKFNYVSPLLMKSTRGLNPLDPLVKEQKAITSKHHTKRTDGDLEKLLELDYKLSAYYDDEVGFFIPADMVEATIREGAKSNRNGKKAQIAVFVEEDKIPLIYDGPKTPEEAFETDEFKDIRPVSVNGNKTLRCRPRFNRWSVEFHVNLNDDIMNLDSLIEALNVAGTQKGIGDYRPRYGRFTTHVEEVAPVRG